MAPANAVLESTVNGPAESVDAGPQHVLDLPQLYSKPFAQSLLAAIALLAVAPPSFAGDAKPSAISEDGIPSYLTRIISSPLAWIESDTDREAIWEAASKRLAERSGRTALPSVSRTFSIPIGPQSSSSSSDTTIDIELHEPSLTGDNLGHKTWVASYLLAKRLPDLLPRHFPGIVRSSQSPASTSPDPHDPNPTPTWPRILELGAGTGLVGIAAAALFQTTIHLTDLPNILPNLTRNITNNAHLTASSTVTAAPLDWSDFDDESNSNSLTDKIIHTSNSNYGKYGNNNERQSHSFDLILASDSLYAPLHPKWLANTISALLHQKNNSNADQHSISARVITILPFRSFFDENMNSPFITKEEDMKETQKVKVKHKEALHEDFKDKMSERGFVVVEEGEEEGWDDWRVGVRCWWCVWRWGCDVK